MLRDILIARSVPGNFNVLRAELRAPHRITGRRFIVKLLPPNSVGAELGVFTGLFSSLLAREPKIAQVSFVDPWWEAFGDHYPDWGAYTDYGRVSTRKAFEIARTRISRAALPNRIIEVAFSYDWLQNQPDQSLDWVYLDSTHSYEGTSRELHLLEKKIKDNGMIFGDDWQTDRNHRHHGVSLAVNAFLKNSNFELMFCGAHSQWVLRRSLGDASPLPLQWTDPSYVAEPARCGD